MNKEGREAEASHDLSRRVGASLRMVRKELSLTQRQLAELFGITQAGVAAIEAGKMNLTVPMLIKLRDRHKVDLASFLAPLVPRHGSGDETSAAGLDSADWQEMYEIYQRLSVAERKWLRELLTVVLKRPS